MTAHNRSMRLGPVTRALLAASLTVALPAIAAAQSGAIPKAPAAEPDFSPSRMRSHVEFLADDLTEGRLIGTRGYDISARYVASAFAALGLQPGGDHGGWFQQIGFTRTTTRSDAHNGITIGGRFFADGGDIAITPSFTDRATDVTAEAVFVGYGIDAPAANFDDYAGLDLKGKIAVMFSGVPKGAPSEVSAHLSTDKFRMAQARGAIAVLAIPDPTLLSRGSWTSLRAARGKAITWNEPDGTPFRRAPGIEASALIDTPASDALFQGAKLSAAKVSEIVAAGGRPKGFALRQRVTIRQSSAIEHLRSANIVAVLPGSDPLLAKEVVVMTAHLDHLGMIAGEPGQDRIDNGAMDNAGGVAVVLEAAHAFATGAARPRRTLVFAVVTGEEEGLLGSTYLAKHPVVPGARVVASLNSDNSVLSYDFADVTAYGADHSTIADAVRRATRAVGVEATADPKPDLAIFVRSDHYSFVQEGVPSLFLLTGYAGAGDAAWADYWKRRYHRPADDLGQAFDWPAAAKLARLNYLVARDLADAPTAPRWYAGDFFGDTFAKGAAKAPRPR